MILVTGAAGKTGRAVIRALAARGQPVRALVHRDDQVQIVRAVGAGEVTVGDLRDAGGLGRAARRASAIYHICPNLHPDEARIGGAMVAAARTASVSRFVYHSVLHPQTQAMPHHWKKLLVEEALFESGLAYTVLQPASYMQNVLAAWPRITEEGVYAVPYAVGTRLGIVDLADVAEAAAVVLTASGHEGAIYELAGAQVLTQTEIAAALSRALRRPVRAECMPIDVWTERARAAGLGDYQVETLLAMFRYYERYGFWGNPNVLSWLLGRPPATFDAFARRIAHHGSA